VPAPGQGALAIECRAADRPLLEILALLDDEATRAAVTAERAVLATLEAGCTAPMGAYGVVSPAESASLPSGWQLSLTAAVVSVDGATTIRRSILGSLGGDDPAGSAARFGRDLAGQLLVAGVAAVIGETA
jgi:hydroxymethylbilane synthase